MWKRPRAIEADEGEAIPDLREALEATWRGEIARVTTPEQLLLREARRITGLSQGEFARAGWPPFKNEIGRAKPRLRLRSLAR